MSAYLTDPTVVPAPKPCRWFHRWCPDAVRQKRPRLMLMRRCLRCGWFQYGEAAYDFREATVRWDKQLYAHDDWGPWPEAKC